MARKTYSVEFRRQAVELCETTPGATVRGIAEDLGIVRGTLTQWLREHGTGRKVAADGTRVDSPVHAAGARSASAPPPTGETPEQELALLRARVRELEVNEAKLTERDVLQKAAKYFGRGDALVSRFQFVADHAATYEVKRLCQLLEVQRSSYYVWLQAAPARAERAAADAALARRIRVLHQGDNTLGAPRVTAELNDGVEPQDRVNRKRVARVMRLEHIVGYVKKRRVITTRPEPSREDVPDLLQRDFTAQAPNMKYVGDITYLPLADGSNWYLATVIDCYSRRLVGWAIADHMRTELVEDALKAAAAQHGSLAGAIFHSDHGSVYTSKDYAKLCRRLQVTPSMGAVGSSADNALAEAFNATFKREVLQDRHSWCDHLSPNTYEATTTTATLATAA
ncbi:IS3 family transposase [Dermacoccus barathri]|uniref:IS3 family transposase n=1 Tax=Dermacoccus barathri TaxID=322601 RepID=UPI0031F9495F